MKFSPYKQVQITWLRGPEASQADLAPPSNPNGLHLQCPYPAEMGEGWIDSLSLSADMLIYQSVHRFCPGVAAQMWPLGAFKLDFPQATLSVHAMHSGNAISRELQPAVDLALRPGEDLFRYGEQGHFIPLLDTSADITVTALVLTETSLVELMGEETAQLLLKGLGLLKAPMARVAAIPSQVTEPLRQSLSSGSSGALHTLYAQSKVLEYLWRLATFVSGSSTARRLAAGEKGALQALYEHLTHLEGEMPTLKDLARQFSISPQALNRGFLRVYGQSIYAMVTNHRLQQAHQALVDGKLPIKAIATRMGYSHVNHFSHAFKMKFGYTPGSLRRAA